MVGWSSEHVASPVGAEESNSTTTTAADTVN